MVPHGYAIPHCHAVPSLASGPSVVGGFFDFPSAAAASPSRFIPRSLRAVHLHPASIWLCILQITSIATPRGPPSDWEMTAPIVPGGFPSANQRCEVAFPTESHLYKGVRRPPCTTFISRQPSRKLGNALSGYSLTTKAQDALCGDSEWQRCRMQAQP